MAGDELNWETFDSLNPYEVAVFAATSPRAIENDEAGVVLGGPTRPNRDRVVLTGKPAYLWAGAVAHLLVHNPSLESGQVREFLHRAIRESGRQMDEVFSGVSLGSSPYVESGVFFVERFLAAAGLSGELDEVRARTADAIRTLEWRGLIEDPFSKRIRNIILSVALIMPVGFTSTGPNEQEVHALTWVYKTQTQAPNQTKRDFHFKVREITQLVIDDLIPEVVSAAEKLTSPEETMSNTEVQQRLKDLGYYHASVDGKVGPKTAEALRHFQMERSLRITGYPDPTTIHALRTASKW